MNIVLDQIKRWFSACTNVRLIRKNLITIMSEGLCPFPKNSYYILKFPTLRKMA